MNNKHDLLDTEPGAMRDLAARARALGFRLMCFKPLNAILRAIVRPFASRLPWAMVHSIPKIGEVVLDLPDGRQVVMLSDGTDSLASRLYWSGVNGFEPESLDLFLDLCETSETVFDVGSHVGLYALLASVDRPEITTYAFEPVARNAASVRANLERNDASGLIFEEMAVGDRDGVVSLVVPSTTRLPATASIVADDGHGDTVEVPIVSLDKYTSDHGAVSVDLIKIDVEGAEVDVLRGARNLIAKHQPAILCEVLHGVGDIEGTNALFEDTNYRFFLVTDDGLISHDRLVGDPTYFYKNYLLIPEPAIESRLSKWTANGRNLVKAA